jgi:hypothetical protein
MSRNIKKGKVWTVDQYDYMPVKIRETQQNYPIMKYLHINGTLDKNHMRKLGLGKWNCHFCFSRESFEFMAQRLTKNASISLPEHRSMTKHT